LAPANGIGVTEIACVFDLLALFDRPPAGGRVQRVEHG
jgi:hypothetical protein